MSLSWPDQTLFEGISTVGSEAPDQPAIIFDDDRYTYEELVNTSRNLAHGLSALGVEKGDIIATWLSNRPEWIVSQLAASYLGVAMVAVNTRYRIHELEYMLSDSGVRVLITEKSFLVNDYHDMIAEVIPEIRTQDPDSFDPNGFPTLEAVVSLKATNDAPAIRGFDEILENGEKQDEMMDPAGDAFSPVAIFYTSGTTSDPKGCLQPSRSLLNHSHNIAEHLDITGSDIGISMLPFCGIWGHNTLFSLLTKAGTMVVHTHFDPETTIESIDQYDVTYLSGVAAMYRRMIESNTFAPDAVESVETAVVGFLGGGFNEEHFDQFEEAFGSPFVQPYGSSEGNSQIFVGEPTDSADRRKRVGGPLIHNAIVTKIVDPNDREPVEVGEQGELALRGYCMFNEYLNKPEANAEAFDEDGWFYTGDLCSVDEEGYHYYHSRLDDALRTRGFLVAPREIETALDAHPNVELSQVVAAPHPRHGEVPVAFVKPIADDLKDDELTSYLDDRVADFKVPAEFVFVDSFPITEGPNGEKIQKGVLRDRVADLYAKSEFG